MAPLVLASSSPWRLALLRQAGLTVEPVAPGVDERWDAGGHPSDMAVGLALRKARAVGAKRPEAWVIGADQVAWEPDRPDAPFGKPPDRSASARRLQRLRGRVHVLTTGLCLIGQGFEDVAVDHATLHMRPDLGEDEIAAYVDTGEGDGCAGGYAVERRGAFLFSRIDGDWNTVIGLPLFRLFDLLRARGWRAS